MQPMVDLANFVSKHRRHIKNISIEESISKLPWYKRPIEREAFTYKKAKDGKYYARHIEWADKIWIGPYSTVEDVNGVIDSYVTKSAVHPLNRITIENDVHSVYVDNAEMFF